MKNAHVIGTMIGLALTSGIVAAQVVDTAALPNSGTANVAPPALATPPALDPAAAVSATISPMSDTSSFSRGDFQHPEVEHNGLEKPEVADIEVEHPQVEHPSMDKPEIADIEVEHLQIELPSMDKPEFEHPEIAKVEIEKPEIQKPELDD